MLVPSAAGADILREVTAREPPTTGAPDCYWFDRQLREAEVAAVRQSIHRGTPFGNETWTRRAASRLGLESTLRPRGRPRQTAKK